MGILHHCKPQKVFSFFEQICAIPHGSGNTAKLADFCVDFAQKRGLRHLRDAANNVIIFKNASVGYENVPPIILQGHLDMVCAKAPSNPLDMTKEGVQIAVDGDWIHANNTSLGGDNGIAVAMALAILDDPTLAHPPLEIVLTTDEETGMDGAIALDTTPLKARQMINLDSEEEGVLTVGCAGGMRVEGVLPISRTVQSGQRCKIVINGLLGGHSGVEIHKGRGNAIQLLGRVLYAIRQHETFGIVSLNGGIVDNAIPLESAADLIVSTGASSKIQEIVEHYNAVFKSEYATTDPNVSVQCQIQNAEDTNATDLVGTDAILCALITAPNGVQVVSADIPDLVQTSLNFGVLHLTDDALHATFSIRSSVESQKYMLRDRLSCLFQSIGGQAICSSEYPGWAYRKESPLRDLVIHAYRDLFHAEPKVIAIHAGLECGLFSDKIPDLDCISLGPNMQDIHTINEQLSISSSARTYQLVLEILKNTKT